MATLQPEVDIANALATALGFTVGTEIKISTEKSTALPGNEAVVIWVAPYSGTFDPLENAAVEGGIYASRVQATVLGPPNDEQAGLALARQVRDAVNLKAPNSYISWLVVPGSAEPMPRGFNESDQPKYSVNFEAKWKATL